MFLKKRFIIVLVCLTALTHAALASEKLRLLTDDYRPLNFIDENGALAGPAVEIVQHIASKLGVDVEIKAQPWARSYKTALKENNTVVFSTSRTEKREKLFKWVGPIAEKKFAFYGRLDFKKKISDIKDIMQYEIGVQRESAAEQTLKELGFKKLQKVVGAELNIKKLMIKRFDLWYTSNSTASETAKKMQIPINQLKEIFVYNSLQQYLAFNREIPDSIVEKWQTELNKMVESKEYHNIFRKYQSETLIPGEYNLKDK